MTATIDKLIVGYNKKIQLDLMKKQLETNLLTAKQPRSNSPARKRPFPGNYDGFCGSSIPVENFRIFSGDFRPVSTGKHWKFVEIHRKKSEKFLTGILLPLPTISGVFQQDTVTFPRLSCSILRDLTAGMFDLGSN